MTINIVLAFDNYAEFVRSLTPEAIDELMKGKEPVITDDALSEMFKGLFEKEDESNE